jgi:hypothetical protein
MLKTTTSRASFEYSSIWKAAFTLQILSLHCSSNNVISEFSKQFRERITEIPETSIPFHQRESGRQCPDDTSTDVRCVAPGTQRDVRAACPIHAQGGAAVSDGDKHRYDDFRKRSKSNDFNRLQWRTERTPRTSPAPGKPSSPRLHRVPPTVPARVGSLHLHPNSQLPPGEGRTGDDGSEEDHRAA